MKLAVISLKDILQVSNTNAPHWARIELNLSATKRYANRFAS